MIPVETYGCAINEHVQSPRCLLHRCSSQWTPLWCVDPRLSRDEASAHEFWRAYAYGPPPCVSLVFYADILKIKTFIDFLTLGRQK